MEDEIEIESVKMDKRFGIAIPKAKARALAMGDSVVVVVRGEVCGISKGYSDDGKYNLDVKYTADPEIKTNAADATVRGLIGEKGIAPAGRHKNEADKSLDDIYTGKKRAY